MTDAAPGQINERTHARTSEPTKQFTKFRFICVHNSEDFLNQKHGPSNSRAKVSRWLQFDLLNVDPQDPQLTHYHKSEENLREVTIAWSCKVRIVSVPGYKRIKDEHAGSLMAVCFHYMKYILQCLLRFFAIAAQAFSTENAVCLEAYWKSTP